MHLSDAEAVGNDKEIDKRNFIGSFIISNNLIFKCAFSFSKV
jgi:hypothetical protein